MTANKFTQQSQYLYISGATHDVLHGLMHGEQKVATCNKICELCEEKFGDDDIVTQRMESLSTK